MRLPLHHGTSSSNMSELAKTGIMGNVMFTAVAWTCPEPCMAVYDVLFGVLQPVSSGGRPVLTLVDPPHCVDETVVPDEQLVRLVALLYVDEASQSKPMQLVIAATVTASHSLPSAFVSGAEAGSLSPSRW